MNNYDMDTLLGTYADWIAWLKAKEASLAGQLARMRGKPDGRPETEDGNPTPEASSSPRETEPEDPAATPAMTEDDRAVEDWL